MKKIILSHLRILVILFATSTTAYAIEAEIQSSHRELSFSEYFFNFCCFTLIIPFIVEGVKTVLPKQHSGINLLISWIIGCLSAALAYYLNLGVFSNFTLIQALAVGFGGTLACNGVFDSGIVTAVLKFFSPNSKN